MCFSIALAGLTCKCCFFIQHRMKRLNNEARNNVLLQCIANLCYAENRMVKVETVPTYLCELSPVPTWTEPSR